MKNAAKWGVAFENAVNAESKMDSVRGENLKELPMREASLFALMTLQSVLI